MTPRLRPVLASAFLLPVLALAGARASAQTSSEEDPRPRASTLTVNARLVLLDVTVTDAAGHPIENLTRNDFRILENGKPQPTRSFEAPAAHTLPGAAASAALDAVFNPASPASFGQSPVTILVLDQLNTHFADSSFARRSIHDFLAAQPELLPQPTELLAVYDRTFRPVHGFTRSRAALLRALDAEPTHYAWDLEVQKSAEYGPLERLDQSLRALEQIAQSGARIPGRKNLIWVGGGFPTLDPTSIDGDAALEVKAAIRHVSDTMLDARVTLSAIDPKSLAPGMAEITDPTTAAFAEITADMGSGSMGTFNGDEDFDRVALLSGGRVVRGLNDVAHQISLDYALGERFYTLGYTPSAPPTASDTFRSIRVLCLRPGTTVTTRIGYFPGTSRRESAPDTISYDLSTAAESTIPLTALRITAQPANSPSAPAPNADPDETADTPANPTAYTIKVGASHLTWKPSPDGSSRANVAIMAVWLDSHHHMLAHTLHSMTATAGPSVNTHDPSKTAEFLFPLPPTPTAAQRRAQTLRFITRDTESGRMGSTDLPLH